VLPGCNGLHRDVPVLCDVVVHTRVTVPRPCYTSRAVVPVRSLHRNAPRHQTRAGSVEFYRTFVQTWPAATATSTSVGEFARKWKSGRKRRSV
jgi:hypothetical protein